MFYRVAAFTAACAFAAHVSAVPAARAANDVWVPRILTPKADTVWTVGKTENITWDTSDAPEGDLSNAGKVVLKHPNPVFTLAEGFDLKAGYVEASIPDDIEPGSGYTITLYGDSGNVSDEFNIEAAA
ncbi:hypothetical protein HDZ31DRAFT_64787 [Schizophyllum fasciatum]